MDSVTPKIRFGIAPGSSARLSEKEREATEAVPSMRIQGGTAARMAEAESQVRTQRPYSMSMQARTGKPFTLGQERPDEPNANVGGHAGGDTVRSASSSQRVAPASAPTDRAWSNRAEERSASLFERQRVSVFAGDAPISKGGSTDKDEKETQTAPRSSFQTLRSFFSRTSPDGVRDKK